jgi:hypothetical protein
MACESLAAQRLWVLQSEAATLRTPTETQRTYA